MGRVQRWTLLIGKFLFGQGVVVVTNFIVGLLIVRFLTVSEYALYVTAAVLLSVCSIGSDMGLSQAIISRGARLRGEQLRLSALLASANRYRGFLYFIMIFITIITAYFMMRDGNWSINSVVLSVLLVLLTGWIKSQVTLRKSILNIHHQADALFHVGIGEAIVRFGMVASLIMWPTALTALVVNLAGVIAAGVVSSVKCQNFLMQGIKPDVVQNDELKKFVIPLIPSVIYFLIQGQLSIFLLSVFGNTAAVAEVGALGRLAQVVVLFMMLNQFLIQPFFARFTKKYEFVFWVGVVFVGLLIISIVCMASVYWAPHWWLYLIGDNYSGLVNELSLVIICAILSLGGATIYSIVISRNITRGQSWTIVGGLGGQVAFVAMHGVETTADALLLNMVSLVSFAIIQIIILAYVIKTWDSKINTKKYDH